MATFVKSADKFPLETEFRFQIRDEELGNSSTWKLRTVKNKGDVYLFPRDSGRWIKSSFHQDIDRWHYAGTNKGQKISHSPDPYLLISVNHEPIAKGWYHRKRIIVAGSELRIWTEPRIDPRIFPIIFPKTHNAIAFDLLLREPGAPALMLERSHPVIAVLERGDGGLAVLLGVPIMTEYLVHEALADLIERTRDDLLKLGWDGSPTRVVIAINPGGTDVHREIEGTLDHF